MTFLFEIHKNYCVVFYIYAYYISRIFQINTSLTSAIPILSIIFVGNYLGIEGNLSDFAIPLLIGIVSGTYSSIFVTVPFLSKIIKN